MTLGRSIGPSFGAIVPAVALVLAGVFLIPPLASILAVGMPGLLYLLVAIGAGALGGSVRSIATTLRA